MFVSTSGFLPSVFYKHLIHGCGDCMAHKVRQDSPCNLACRKCHAKQTFRYTLAYVSLFPKLTKHSIPAARSVSAKMKACHEFRQTPFFQTILEPFDVPPQVSRIILMPSSKKYGNIMAPHVKKVVSISARRNMWASITGLMRQSTRVFQLENSSLLLVLCPVPHSLICLPTQNPWQDKLSHF